jgi:hypothetical protein
MTIVGQYENAGSMSSFYVIDNKRGFKEFCDKSEAEYAHSVQSKLEDYNMAPYVLSQVGKIRKSNGELSDWGYITEIAKTIGCGGNSCSCGDCDDNLEFSYDNRISKLARKMEEVGVEFMDCHIGNVGFVRRNGRKVMVCIDFGTESVCDEDCSIDPYDDDHDCSCIVCQQQRGSNV